MKNNTKTLTNEQTNYSHCHGDHRIDATLSVSKIQITVDDGNTQESNCEKIKVYHPKMIMTHRISK
jgi:hypothetical protein